MKPLIKFIVIVSTIPLLIGLYFFDNIKGYYRFKQYCANEGGLRVYQPLEKNVGWWADDYDSAHMAAQLKHVAFVRYIDKKDGKKYDLQYLGGYPQNRSSFKKIVSNESVPIKYKWININSFLGGERNLFHFGYDVLEAKKNTILVRYYMFEYLLYIGPFDAKSTESCFRGGGEFGEFPSWKKNLDTAFMN